MAIQILMPALSPTMTEGNLVKWHKREGDLVKAGDIIAEIETDKATMEVEAVDEGSIGKILVPEGTEQVKVNQPIAILLEEGEDSSALEKMVAPASLAPVSTMAEIPPATHSAAPAATASAPAATASAPAATASAPAGVRAFASPLARRLAERAQINLQTLSGSGPRGRIVKADVENAINQPAIAPSGAPSSLLSGYEPGYDILPTSSVRRIIAKRLTEAKQTVPHFYLSVDCNIDNLLQMREQLNKHGGGEVKLSVNDMVIKACALALKKVPAANASWINDQIYQYKSADIAVAVAIDGGLITPVIRESETKGLFTISREMKDLASKARAGKLHPSEFQGGTFSLSNLGMYGITSFSAIINPPQGCILAVGAGVPRPIVKEGQMIIATLMTCTLSVDHRVVDGAVGAALLKAFQNLIENPVLMMGLPE